MAATAPSSANLTEARIVKLWQTCSRNNVPGALIIAIGSLLLLLIVGVCASSVSAQDETPPVTLGNKRFGGLDLVFLIDQSGSMQTNDPYQQRVNTISWVVENLGIDNLFFRPEADNRIAIVSFGSQARIDLPLVSLRVTDSATQGNDLELEERWRKRYVQELKPRIVAEDMGNTDVLAGLELVKQVFDEAGPPSTNSPRSRGVIIITDGPPYREGWREDPQFVNSNFYTPYFRLMGNFIQQNLQIASTVRTASGYHIWVLGLNATADTGGISSPGTSWLEQEARWQRIVNPSPGIDRVVRVSSQQNADIPAVIVRVLDTMMLGGVCGNDDAVSAQPTCLISEQFIVPPYLDRAIFSIFKPRPTSQIEFVMPDGQKLDRSSALVKQAQFGGLIETVTLQRPLPGSWRWQKVDASPETAIVKFDPLFSKTVLIEPKSDQNLFDTVGIRIKLQDRSGTTVRPLDEYPIRASAQVKIPDGRTRDFELVTDSDGTLRSQQTLFLDQPGQYSILLSANTSLRDGTPIKIFQDLELDFRVGALKPVLSQPQGTVQLFHETAIEFQLQKPDGSQPGRSSQTSIRWEVTLTEPDGRSSQMEIVSNATENRYRVSQPIITQTPGTYELRAQGYFDNSGQNVKLFDDRLVFTVDCLNADLVSPDSEIPQSGRTAIELDIVECSGRPFVEDGKIPLQTAAVVIRPTGVTSSLQLQRVADGKYSTQFTPDAAGPWKIKVNSTALLPDGTNTASFEEISRDLHVYSTTRVALQVVEPEANKRQSIRTLPRVFLVPESAIGKPTSTQVRVQVANLDNGNQLLAINEIEQIPGQLVTSKITGPSGFTANQPVTLTQATDNPYQLVATLNDLNVSGEYALAFILKNLKREYVSETPDPVTVNFQRFDPTLPITYAILALQALMTGTILFVIVRFFVVRINPVRGTLEFGVKSGIMGWKPLGAINLATYGKNVFLIDQRALRHACEPDVSSVVSRIRVKNTTQRSPKAAPEGSDSSLGNSAIRVWAYNSNKEELIPGEELFVGSDVFVTDRIYLRFRE